MKTIERRLATLEDAQPFKSAPVRRGLDDFYKDLSQPNSDAAKALDQMYQQEANHDASH